MRIYMLIYLVSIIMFISWYKHGMGKKRFKNLEFSLWITLNRNATIFMQRKLILNCLPQNGDQFVSTSMCWHKVDPLLTPLFAGSHLARLAILFGSNIPRTKVSRVTAGQYDKGVVMALTLEMDGIGIVGAYPVCCLSRPILCIGTKWCTYVPMIHTKYIFLFWFVVDYRP